ncbi:hypothetical protein FA15DRAFT_667705 [Coprinopsis marcescibilis]|uniref:Glycosyl transferase CAP10 domain-containing protein n=1 Tax=Coprinopsis marcescibilis TaxID=230819 RepID=A0A5C3KZS2_COPMA|nr:hypothetical protein FA15DRAFT_667705 [Coprinopsis marcescibilis]
MLHLRHTGRFVATHPRVRASISRVMQRHIRGPVLMVIAVGAAVFLAGMVHDWVHPWNQPSTTTVERSMAYNIDDHILTTTLIRTAITTETIIPEPSNMVDSSSSNPPLDAFGFLIQSLDLSTDSETPLTQASSAPSNAKHFYRADGLLEVNSQGPHPIFELVEQAEQQWREKRGRASRTLKEACVEYARRYGRQPPWGFERWWRYAKRHNVQLPDEYNQIHQDLEPFWGMDPKQLQFIQREYETRGDSYTVGKDVPNSPLRMLRGSVTSAEDERIANQLHDGADMIADLLREVEQDLPSFRATFSPHDNPNLLSDWELREEAIQAAKRGEYLDLTQSRNHRVHGWKTACPQNSPIWLNSLPTSSANGVTSPPTLRQLEKFKFTSPYSQHDSFRAGRYPKTFIYNHSATFSPCEHPAHLLLHGQFLRYGSGGPVSLRAQSRPSGNDKPPIHFGMVPVFSYSPTRLHDEITAAVPNMWSDDIYPRNNDPLFHDKPDSRLHWRGSNTGMWHGNSKDAENIQKALSAALGETRTDVKLRIGPDRAWWLSQRGRLVNWANRMWEGRHEMEPLATASTNIGVPHELWKRSADSEIIERDLGPSNDTDPPLRPHAPHTREAIRVAVSRGVLRSPPSNSSTLSRRDGRGEPQSGGDTHESRSLLKSEWAPAMTDIAFAGFPLACEGTTCDHLREMYEFRKAQGTKEQGQYKFIMDVDGNGWSSRFKRLITTNSLIFKSTIYAEWFTDRIQPWVHYVPIQVDYSDLLDALYFFRGDPSYHNNHLSMAAKIAKAGRDWSKAYWRKEDMAAYMYRLFLEYARVMGDENGERNSYTYRPEDEV